MPENNKKLVWLKLDIEKMAKLQALALRKQRSLNGLIIELIDQAILNRNSAKR
jgi:hypothetical protein